MKENKIKMYIILHVFLMVSSFVAIASKLAAQETFLSLRFILYYAIVIINLGVYAIVWQQIIKKIPLTTAYANKSVGVVWGIVWGFLLFHENVTVQKVIGAIVIMIGIVLVVTEKEDTCG